MGKVLIQANNLDLVVDTFMYIYMHPGCSKQELADYCGFTLRQADYYTNACKYLDLINDDWSKTTLAVDIFTNNPAEISERIYARIISDELMGQIFARIYVLPNEDHSTFALELTKEYYPGYSETVYERRSDNIVKWCRRIIEEMNTKY
ncbi:hypothetical protein PRMUPPPA20_15370 [Xylanibacter ruminicola]|jgi:hypothetical protein|uniref:DUF7226 domain-containing protein n=1 Tax=Xylanibacter ruminicola TaxID=839 RepID=A0AA37I3L8_XYLRU|nr:hypothetical protein [Xylanibacter ruminicola]GJG33428.1 hypothetical protein PRMUPPPA20_15370 [Xylanibacter ruminicola]SEH71986.1 hypothetical protein SAMN02745192_1148 [Xylanibacter ruminicola]